MNKKIFFTCIIPLVVFWGCSTRGKGTYTHQESYSNTSSPKKYKYNKATMRPYTVRGKKYYPTVVNVGDRFRGIASWYGPDFHGKWTSNGEKYNMYDLTAAHKTLPMNTILKVTNKRNNKSVVVRINDRGPFVNNRIIDLSKAAAKKIGMIGTGTAPVELEVIGFATKNKMPTKKELKKTPKSVPEGNFALQIGSFSKIEGAMKFQEKYDGIDGYTTIIKDVENQYGRMYKVLLRGFKSETEARDYKKVENLNMLL